MVKEAEAHADEDKKKRETVDARNQLDGLVYQTEKTLAEHGATLDAETRGGHRDRARRGEEGARAAGRGAHPQAPPTTLGARVAQARRGDVRQGVARPVGRRRRSRRRTGDGRAAARPKDDVVEAEFEEVKE